jgi:hypothetical protein
VRNNVKIQNIKWLSPILIITSSCFQGPGFLQQSGSAVGLGKMAVTSNGEEVFSSTVGNNAITQVVEIGTGSEIAGSSVMLPPGTLAVGTELLVQAAGDIANSDLGVDLDLDSGTEITSAGSAVAVTTSNNVAASNAFTISLPIPSRARLSNLFGLLEEYELLVVVYKVVVPGTSDYITGIIPRSEFNVEDDKAAFETDKFGVFQLAYTSQKVEERKEAETSSGFVTRTEEKALPAITWALSVELTTERTAKFGFTLGGMDTIDRCIVTVDQDKVAPWNVYASIGQDTSYSAEPLAEATHTVYARFSCRDMTGRESGYSAWKEYKFEQLLALQAPVVTSAAALTNNPKPLWSWTGSSSTVVFRYKLDNEAAFTETTSKSFQPATNLSGGAHVLYVQEGDGGGRWSSSGSFSVTVDVTAPPAASFTTLLPGTTSTSTANVTLKGATDATGDIYQVSLYKDAACTQLLGSASQALYVASGISFVATSNATTSIYGKNSDQAGNSSSCLLLTTFTHDNIAPTVSAGADQSSNSSFSLTATATGQTSVTWTVSPPGCSISSPASLNTSITCGADNVYTATVTVSDAVSQSANDSVVLTRDTTAPSFTSSLSESVTWIGNPTTATLTLTTGENAVFTWGTLPTGMTLGSATTTATSSSRGATFDHQGTYTVSVTATDAVGNPNTATLTITVTDSTPPPTLVNYYAKPGASYGTVALHYTLPTVTTDYSTMTAHYSTSPNPNCGTTPSMSINAFFGSSVFTANQVRKVVIKGLDPAQSYYFAICITDPFGNSTVVNFPSVVSPSAHRIFVTDSTFGANLTVGYGAHSAAFSSGLLGADHRCQGIAASKGFHGYYKAVLSDAYNGAQTRLKFAAGSEIDDMMYIADSNNTMTTNNVASPTSNMWSTGNNTVVGYNEMGTLVSNQIVWSGSDSTGNINPSNEHCANWTISTSGAPGGRAGINDATAGGWMFSQAENCNMSHRLYCVDQPVAAPEDFYVQPGGAGSGILNVKVDLAPDVSGLSYVKVYHSTGNGTVPTCSGTPVVAWASPSIPTTLAGYAHPLTTGSTYNNYRLCYFDGGGTLIGNYTIMGVTAP